MTHEKYKILTEEDVHIYRIKILKDAFEYLRVKIDQLNQETKEIQKKLEKIKK